LKPVEHYLLMSSLLLSLKVLKHRVFCMVFILIVLFSALSSSVSALTEEDRIRLFTPFYDSTSSLNSCSEGGGLVGSDSKEQVWNYLIGKGMTSVQAAGSMGNLQHEGGFNPKIVERGHMEGQTWRNQAPFQFPSEMDTLPPYNLAPIVSGRYAGQPGYGIVQWTTPDRKQGLKAMADNDERKLPVNNLRLQLDYMWSELEGPYKEDALDPLLATNDLATAVRIWQDHYEVGRGFEPRMQAAQEILAEYGSGTPSTSGSTSSTPSSGCSSGLEGVVCPANLQAHPSRAGYYLLPEAPNGEYNVYSSEEQRYGSKQLVCVIYSVALAFNNAMQGRSRLRIGDLNASGHKTHNQGTAVDLSGEGELQVASHTADWKGTYDKDATILLGRLFADTGVLRNIWWCNPGDDSTEQITSYAESRGLEGDIRCIEGHSDHFHIDIYAEYRLEFWEP
jgi:hypothetical protein